MKVHVLFRWLVAVGPVLLVACSQWGGEGVTLYQGASVWHQGSFVEKDFAVADDRFVAVGRAGPESRRVDLSGLYVTPAYGNAHQHITSANMESSRRFTDLGVFYVWNPNSMATLFDEDSDAFFSRPDTYDLKNALGGITEPGGHPEKLYVDILSKWVYKGRDREFFIDNAFYYGRDGQEIAKALDHLVAEGADIVKIYLLHSEDYARRRDDDAFYGAKGLNPENISAIVAAAHARGLPVTAHIETAHDFRIAVAAGVDVLAHLPGYGPVRKQETLTARRLSGEDAAAAARARTAVVPTYNLARAGYEKRLAGGEAPDAALVESHYALQANNIRLLRQAGVPVLLGTDADLGIVNEATHLVKIGALTPAQALAAIYRTGPALFPERRIGRIAPGYSADFLVLEQDPLVDLTRLENIRARFKSGIKLQESE